jgi:hypothetical protein
MIWRRPCPNRPDFPQKRQRGKMGPHRGMPEKEKQFLGHSGPLQGKENKEKRRGEGIMASLEYLDLGDEGRGNMDGLFF